MDDFYVHFVIALLIIFFYGSIGTLIIFFIRKGLKKIKDKKRQKAWKASAEAAAKQEAEEEAARKAEEEKNFV